MGATCCAHPALQPRRWQMEGGQCHGPRAHRVFPRASTPPASRARCCCRGEDLLPSLCQGCARTEAGRDFYPEGFSVSAVQRGCGVQGILVTGRGEMAVNKNRSSTSTRGRISFREGWQSTGTAPGKGDIPNPLGCAHPIQVTLPGQLGWTWRSPGTPTTLNFAESWRGPPCPFPFS